MNTGRKKNKVEQGSAMLIVLIILTSVSILSLSSMQDLSMQLNMVRNNQFYVNAYHVAYSEINAQLDVINTNSNLEDDALILDLMQQDVDEMVGFDFVGPHSGAGAYTQTLQIAPSCEAEVCPSPPGYSMGSFTRVLRGEIASVARLGASGSQSNQSQNFWYLLPQSGGHVVTFD
ncbi:MAG: hypothetical protein AB8B48_21150 [Pseudomonadales bacterium]